ncbi:methionine ABC transporter permease [Symbiobacterium thermophilum]|uniref:ABC transporter permease protein n=2 Tax=Symbiobacterium thermophilum TaxID=2734 RepID=Q67SV4_SYMTH|nr:methionine ABC transporter permease [Symbiobacterium thermophilum]MBY6275192.1 ABC transporter permease [Symbiobacterium thermophilum]BAD39239.1 ABC transporter permease protein [Symbiobacterium thermophilum IAM 14863]
MAEPGTALKAAWAAFYADLGRMMLEATKETLYMVGVAGLFTVLLGLPLGVLLVITARDGLWEKPALNRILGVLVNIGRSTPFVILMVAVSPLTRAIVGKSIGTTAAIVPLVVAAVPFMGRVVEQALHEVGPGKIEAALAMGSSNWQVVTKVLLAEARPSLVRGTALMLVNLVGYSAMAGAIGGGGLGDVAVKWGYNRFQMDVMYVSLVILVIMVQVVQWIGDSLANRFSHK